MPRNLSSQREAKANAAVEAAVKMISTAGVLAALGLGGGVTSMVTAPTIARHVCGKIAGTCYDLPKDVVSEITSTFSRIICKNLVMFAGAKTFRGCVLGGSIAATVLTFGFSAPTLLPTTMKIEAPSAARLVVKCAVDLIIILDYALSQGYLDNSLSAGMEVAKICRFYRKERIQGGDGHGYTRRRASHSDINEVFPSQSSKAALAYVGQDLTKETAKIKAIVRKYRLADAVKVGAIGEADEESSDDEKELLEVEGVAFN